MQKSTSKYAAPAFFFVKKDDSIRTQIDFRKLNKELYEVPGAFPTVYEDLHLLKGKSFFSKVDLKSGCYQIPIDIQDSYKLSFITPLGQYERLRMPFGLATAPKIFQKVMKDILSGLDFVKIYLDDVIISSSSAPEHLLHCKLVLERLKEYNVSINEA